METTKTTTTTPRKPRKPRAKKEAAPATVKAAPVTDEAKPEAAKPEAKPEAKEDAKAAKAAARAEAKAEKAKAKEAAKAKRKELAAEAHTLIAALRTHESNVVRCACGCEAEVPRKFFIPGHDAKLLSMIINGLATIVDGQVVKTNG